MANRPPQARNYFAALLIIVAGLYALIFFTGSVRTPQLGLDLRGGTTVTLTAKTTNGKPPAQADLELARQIGATAQLRSRPVVSGPVAAAPAPTSASASASGSASGSGKATGSAASA